MADFFYCALVIFIWVKNTYLHVEFILQSLYKLKDSAKKINY